jgi:hypothetical protein
MAYPMPHLSLQRVRLGGRLHSRPAVHSPRSSQCRIFSGLPNLPRMGQFILGIVGQEPSCPRGDRAPSIHLPAGSTMVESRRHEQEIALPLLSNPEDPHVTSHQAGNEDWTHSSPHGKYSKWVAFPFRRIVQALLAIIALVALGFAIYGSVIGFHAYRRLVFPHRAVHASLATVKDGSRVVKPYFAPKAKGGVQNGTLLVRIWFKDGEKEMSLPASDESRELDWADMWRRERLILSMSNIGETGYVDNTLVGTEGQASWIEQFAHEIPIRDIESTEDMVARVTLPGETMYVHSPHSSKSPTKLANSADTL